MAIELKSVVAGITELTPVISVQVEVVTVEAEVVLYNLFLLL
jgi:hypothetical protein